MTIVVPHSLSAPQGSENSLLPQCCQYFVNTFKWTGLYREGLSARKKLLPGSLLLERLSWIIVFNLEERAGSGVKKGTSQSHLSHEQIRFIDLLLSDLQSVYCSLLCLVMCQTLHHFSSAALHSLIIYFLSEAEYPAGNTPPHRGASCWEALAKPGISPSFKYRLGLIQSCIYGACLWCHHRYLCQLQRISCIKTLKRAIL